MFCYIEVLRKQIETFFCKSSPKNTFFKEIQPSNKKKRKFFSNPPHISKIINKHIIRIKRKWKKKKRSNINYLSVYKHRLEKKKKYRKKAINHTTRQQSLLNRKYIASTPHYTARKLNYITIPTLVHNHRFATLNVVFQFLTKKEKKKNRE